MPGASKNIIPIKNLFYLLCYAWNVLPIMNDIKVGSEEIEDAYNLLARVFTYGVSKLIRSGFHRSYIETNEELSSLRGKIDIQQSINGMTFKKRSLSALMMSIQQTIYLIKSLNLRLILL